jgi:S-ribosylhomocysteine lyase
VRLAGTYRGERGDVVAKYDLRLVQPNVQEIPTGPLHTIEHLLAGYLRDELPGTTLVDASPMGCRTGFYLTLLGEPAEEDLRAAAERALAAVRDHDGPIPGCSPERCGNWRDHSLPGATGLGGRGARPRPDRAGHRPPALLIGRVRGWDEGPA